MQTRPISLLLVLSSRLLSDTLEAALNAAPGLNLIGRTQTAKEALSEGLLKKPDVIFVDFYLPDKNALELILEFKKRRPDQKFLVLLPDSKEALVRQLMAAEAQGIISSEHSLPDLQKALQLIANGASFFPRQTERLRDQAENPLLYANSRDIQDPLKPLTTREREIFYLLACGLPNRSIARQHSLNPKTVQTHRAKMLKKLGLKSTAELVRFALKHDLIRN